MISASKTLGQSSIYTRDVVNYIMIHAVRSQCSDLHKQEMDVCSLWGRHWSTHTM